MQASTAVVSLAVEHGLWNTGSGAGCMGSVAPQRVGSSWIKDRTCVPPVLAGGFLTSGQPGKSQCDSYGT